MVVRVCVPSQDTSVCLSWKGRTQEEWAVFGEKEMWWREKKESEREKEGVRGKRETEGDRERERKRSQEA